MGRILVEKDVEAAVKGGSVYAAGGGGWADHGRMLGRAAVNAGKPELVTIDELKDDDWVATAAAIGAPASTTPWEMRGVDYVKAVQLLQDALGAPLAALMIGQNGRSSTLNAWLPSAILGVKALGRGWRRARPSDRRHGLHRHGRLARADDPDGRRRQPGGEPLHGACREGRDGEGFAGFAHRGGSGWRLHRFGPQSLARLLRPHACGARRHIAGADDWARRSSRRSAAAGAAVIDAICKTTGGHILAEGTIRAKRVAYMNEAFDIGSLVVGDGDRAVTLHVMNEYMAVDDAGGMRLATFPSVITTLSPDGEPLSVGELREGMRVFVLHVPKEILPLSASVLDATVYPSVEKAMGIEIARYALAGRGAA